jgi:hypothetical protein
VRGTQIAVGLDELDNGKIGNLPSYHHILQYIYNTIEIRGFVMTVSGLNLDPLGGARVRFLIV